MPNTVKYRKQRERGSMQRNENTFNNAAAAVDSPTFYLEQPIRLAHLF